MKGYCANHVTFDIVRMRENVMTEHVHARTYPGLLAPAFVACSTGTNWKRQTLGRECLGTRLARYYTDKLAPPTACIRVMLHVTYIHYSLAWPDPIPHGIGSGHVKLRFITVDHPSISKKWSVWYKTASHSCSYNPCTMMQYSPSFNLTAASMIVRTVNSPFHTLFGARRVTHFLRWCIYVITSNGLN